MKHSALDCALWLAAHGMHVFPVDHPSLSRCAGAHRNAQACDDKRGKHPCGKWSRDATADPTQIRRAFGHAPRNIGIDCGRSGLLVVDEDEPDALAAYAHSIGAELGATFTVITSRGAHRYYRQPDGQALGNSPGDLAAFHCDVRGRGGFVVGPGSVHESGHYYRPVDARVPIAAPPPWLLSALAPRPAAPRPHTPRRHCLEAHAGRDAAVLDSLRQVVASGTNGNRNARLFWSACRAHEHVNAGLFDDATAVGALLEAAATVGLSEPEARATITSAQRNTGSRTPR